MNLFEHQQKIVNEDPKRTGLWMGTGSGKTRTALALASGNDYKNNTNHKRESLKRSSGRTLVICPKTQKEDQNWERELTKMGIKLDLHVISKETFRRDYKSIGAFDTVIVDEAETCLGVTPNTRQKNRVTIPKASQLFDALQEFINETKPNRLYLCTATITRSPMTVWAAAKLLGYDWNWYEWRDTFYQELPIPGRKIYAVKSGEHQKQKLAEKVNEIGYVGRLEDWFDVPDQTFKNDYVELTAPQKHAINEIKIEYPDPIVAIGKRHQVENGVLKGDEFSSSQTFKSAKNDKIIQYAAEFPKLIIFAKYTEQIKEYEKLLNKDYAVYTLTGETKDRSTLFQKLEAADKAILIAQAQISAGWEWKGCPAMVFASRSYSIADYIQGQGRIQRTDAIKKNLYINLITKGGIDEALHKSIENKKDFSERVYAEKLV